MQLDPDKRYLLSRPQGGFNDVMAQIEKSRLYAEKFDRVLVLDTTRSGLRERFGDVFDVKDTFGCKVQTWDDDMADAFDASTSVRPAQLRHRISTATINYKSRYKGFIDTQSHCLVNFDFSKDHVEHVLVYEQAGGGSASFSALKKLSLAPDIAQVVLERLATLGSDFDAVHIRHSDYKTKFAVFLKRLRPILRGRRVLVCSDSTKAIDAAAKILAPSTTVFGISDIPDLEGKPLHLTKGVDGRTATIDLLTDLIAMSLASELFYTRVSTKRSLGTIVSGFSMLADVLRRNREVAKGLFIAADPAMVDALFDQPRVNTDPDRTRQLSWYRWWNIRALSRSRKFYRIAMEDNFKPEEIGAFFRD